MLAFPLRRLYVIPSPFAFPANGVRDLLLLFVPSLPKGTASCPEVYPS